MVNNIAWRVVHVTGGGGSVARYCIERFAPTLFGFRYRWQRCGKTADGHRTGDLEFPYEAPALREMRKMQIASEPEEVTLIGGSDE